MKRDDQREHAGPDDPALGESAPGERTHNELTHDDLVLGGFQQLPDDDGLSLEELSAAYAELLQRGSTPYEESATTEPPAAEELSAEPPKQVDEPPPVADLGCDLTPRSILEAMLFVGNANNQPLTSKQVTSLMRGVRPQEIDELIQELNEQYSREGAPYVVVSVDAGYLMQLRPEFASLRETFLGRVKEARLTQPAIDVLAIVAYRQPIAREEIDRLRTRPSGSILAQLVRRGLLRLDLVAGDRKVGQYTTTDRFLRLFGLDSLAELPQSHDVLPGEEG